MPECLHPNSFMAERVRSVSSFRGRKRGTSIHVEEAGFKFEKIAMANGFSFREQAQCRMVNMYGKNIGVEVEIFEAVPSVYAVDVRKTDGDTAINLQSISHQPAEYKPIRSAMSSGII